MLRAQFLRKLQALFSVASAFRSGHRRHHRLGRYSAVENSAFAACVPRFEPEFHHEGGNKRSGAAFKWQAIVKCERLGALS